MLTGPGGTRNDSPLTSQASRYLPPIAAILCSIAVR
jgi:hypothetical protein